MQCCSKCGSQLSNRGVWTVGRHQVCKACFIANSPDDWYSQVRGVRESLERRRRRRQRDVALAIGMSACGLVVMIWVVFLSLGVLLPGI